MKYKFESAEVEFLGCNEKINGCMRISWVARLDNKIGFGTIDFVLEKDNKIMVYSEHMSKEFVVKALLEAFKNIKIVE